jgi:hypothetical protein
MLDGSGNFDIAQEVRKKLPANNLPEEFHEKQDKQELVVIFCLNHIFSYGRLRQ